MAEPHLVQQLYDSEINFAFSAIWDSGFAWKLGDPLNGFVAEGSARTFAEASAALAQAAVAHFPESVFAQSSLSRGGGSPGTA